MSCVVMPEHMSCLGFYFSWAWARSKWSSTAANGCKVSVVKVGMSADVDICYNVICTRTLFTFAITTAAFQRE